MTLTVYLTLDDNNGSLTQRRWFHLNEEVEALLDHMSLSTGRVAHSSPVSLSRMSVYIFEIAAEITATIETEVAALARGYDQDYIELVIVPSDKVKKIGEDHGV
jgi:hypothetical protein